MVKRLHSNTNFFIISDNGPTITLFDLDYNVSDPRFVKNAQSYITTATQIDLIGRVTNGLSHNAVIDVTVQLPGKSTEIAIAKTITTVTPANGDPAYDDVRVNDYTFPADTYGEFIFNLRVKAASGSEVKQQIRITKEPQPYRIIDPLSLGNSTGFQDLVLIKKLGRQGAAEYQQKLSDASDLCGESNTSSRRQRRGAGAKGISGRVPL